MPTLSVTSLINKPGIGFVPYQKDEEVMETLEAAKDMLEASKSLWVNQKDATVVEEVEGVTFTVQAEKMQLKFEVSE
jgi:hypothetical protein